MVGVVTQTRLHGVDLFTRDCRSHGEDLHFHLHWHVGYTVLGETVEVAAHVSRGGFDVTCEFALHLLYASAVSHHCPERFTQVGDGFAEHLLDFLLGAE